MRQSTRVKEFLSTLYRLHCLVEIFTLTKYYSRNKFRELVREVEVCPAHRLGLLERSGLGFFERSDTDGSRSRTPTKGGPK